MTTATTAPEFAGRVLAIGEMNYHDDSDFYAMVWDGQSVRRIQDGTTRFAAPARYHHADATPDVIEAATAWMVDWLRPQVRDQLERKERVPKVGDTVAVVRGRKVQVGTEAQVFWAAMVRPWGQEPRGGYNANRPNVLRVGIKLADGTKVFLAGENVVKLNVQPVDEADVDRIARANAGDFRRVGSGALPRW